MRHRHRRLRRYQDRRRDRGLQHAKSRWRINRGQTDEATVGESVGRSFKLAVSSFKFTSQLETRNLTLETDLMPVAVLTLELRIEGAHSLKDKRQVLRSLKDKLRNSFNISIAEIDVTDLWQRATLGVVSISGSRDYLEGLMRNVEQAATRQANNLGAEVVDSFMDYLES